MFTWWLPEPSHCAQGHGCWLWVLRAWGLSPARVLKDIFLSFSLTVLDHLRESKQSKSVWGDPYIENVNSEGLTSDSTVGRAFALLVTDPGSIPDIAFSPLSLPEVSPECHRMWLKNKNKQANSIVLLWGKRRRNKGVYHNWSQKIRGRTFRK